MTREEFEALVRARMKLANAAYITKHANLHVCSTRCHIPGSQKGVCAKCGTTIYFADFQQAGLLKICQDCAEKMPEFRKGIYFGLRNSVWDGYPEN